MENKGFITKMLFLVLSFGLLVPSLGMGHAPSEATKTVLETLKREISQGFAINDIITKKKRMKQIAGEVTQNPALGGKGKSQFETDMQKFGELKLEELTVTNKPPITVDQQKKVLKLVAEHLGIEVKEEGSGSGSAPPPPDITQMKDLGKAQAAVKEEAKDVFADIRKGGFKLKKVTTKMPKTPQELAKEKEEGKKVVGQGGMMAAMMAAAKKRQQRVGSGTGTKQGTKKWTKKEDASKPKAGTKGTPPKRARIPRKYSSPQATKFLDYLESKNDPKEITDHLLTLLVKDSVISQHETLHYIIQSSVPKDKYKKLIVEKISALGEDDRSKLNKTLSDFGFQIYQPNEAQQKFHIRKMSKWEDIIGAKTPRGKVNMIEVGILARYFEYWLKYLNQPFISKRNSRKTDHLVFIKKLEQRRNEGFYKKGDEFEEKFANFEKLDHKTKKKKGLLDEFNSIITAVKETQEEEEEKAKEKAKEEAKEEAKKEEEMKEEEDFLRTEKAFKHLESKLTKCLKQKLPIDEVKIRGDIENFKKMDRNTTSIENLRKKHDEIYMAMDIVSIHNELLEKLNDALKKLEERKPNIDTNELKQEIEKYKNLKLATLSQEEIEVKQEEIIKKIKDEIQAEEKAYVQEKTDLLDSLKDETVSAEDARIIDTAIETLEEYAQENDITMKELKKEFNRIVIKVKKEVTGEELKGKLSDEAFKTKKKKRKKKKKEKKKKKKKVYALDEDVELVVEEQLKEDKINLLKKETFEGNDEATLQACIDTIKQKVEEQFTDEDVKTVEHEVQRKALNKYLKEQDSMWWVNKKWKLSRTNKLKEKIESIQNLESWLELVKEIDPKPEASVIKGFEDKIEEFKNLDITQLSSAEITEKHNEIADPMEEKFNAAQLLEEAKLIEENTIKPKIVEIFTQNEALLKDESSDVSTLEAKIKEIQNDLKKNLKYVRSERKEQRNALNAYLKSQGSNWVIDGKWNLVTKTAYAEKKASTKGTKKKKKKKASDDPVVQQVDSLVKALGSLKRRLGGKKTGLSTELGKITTALGQ